MISTSGLVTLQGCTIFFFFIYASKKRFFCFFFLINLFVLFIYFWLCWVFVAAHGLSLVAASGGYSSLQCTGFSLRWLLLLQSTGSRACGLSSCGSWALERRLSSCGARAQLLRGMWNLPEPGLKPVSSALAGGFLTTAPPGKHLETFLTKGVYQSHLENFFKMSYWTISLPICSVS